MKRVLVAILIVLLVMICYVMYLQIALPSIPLRTDIQIENSESQIQRGKYIVENVAQCFECHSTRDYELYSAPMKLGSKGVGGEAFDQKKGFPGDFYAPNLTPAYLSDWTDAELYRAIANGVNKDGNALFPIMPYPNYSQLSEDDIFSIIAYLRQVPSNGNPEDVKKSSASFPFSIILKTIPQHANHDLPYDENDMVTRGKYVVTMASCADCHTPQDKGEFIEELRFAGGMLQKMPNGKYVKTANLTPDNETGLGEWTEDRFVGMFKSFLDSANVMNVGPDDFNTSMPWTGYAKMDTIDLKAIFAYLQTLEPKTNPVEKRFYSESEK